MFNIRLDAAWFNSRFAVAAGQALLGSLFVVSGLVCTENPIRVDDVMESPKLAE
jgi:hypothetical protein